MVVAFQLRKFEIFCEINLDQCSGNQFGLQIDIVGYFMEFHVYKA
jgi:hypothetical protein